MLISFFSSVLVKECLLFWLGGGVTVCATVVSELEEVLYMMIRQVLCSEIKRKLGLHG